MPLLAPRKIELQAAEGLATGRIQAAIDQASEGPVELVFAPGLYICEGLRLRSDVIVTLQKGAELHFAPFYDAYAYNEVAVEAEQSNRAMIVAKDAQRITLRGEGRISCEGSTQFITGEDTKMGTLIPAPLRPRVMVLDGCADVRIEGLHVVDAPMWTLHFVDCNGLQLHGLNIDNNRHMPNTDGIVIDGCQNVAITNCEIRTADDGIVLKTSARTDGRTATPCTNILARDTLIESRSCAVKIGTESYADFTDITFKAINIVGSNRALGIFSRDGGAVARVRFEQITLTCEETPDGYWGSGEPITITALDRRPQTPAGAVSGITFCGISGSCHGAISLYAAREGLVDGITLEGVSLTQTPGALGTAQRYDIRPTYADLLPSEDAAGRINAWRMGPDGKVIGLIDYPGGFPGLFAAGVTGLVTTNVTITRPDPLPKGWARQAQIAAPAGGNDGMGG